MPGQPSRRSGSVTAPDRPACRVSLTLVTERKIGERARTLPGRAAKARDLEGLCVPWLIHISTAPLVHSWTGADQQVYRNYPQTCAQGVILAGQGPQVSLSRERKPVISRYSSCRTGRR